MSCITGDYGDSAVRCNKNTKSESYSQLSPALQDIEVAVRCNKNTKSESYSQSQQVGIRGFMGCALQQKY